MHRAVPPVPRSFRPPTQAGYTLVELLIVVIIIGIAAAIAFPNFRAIINGNNLTAATNEVVATMQVARLEAMRRNARVVVCASTDGASCGGTNWGRHIVFTDTDLDGTVDAGETILRDTSISAPVVVNASAAVTSSKISFRSDGLARAGTGATILNGRIGVCIVTTKPPQNARQIVLNGSRVSVAAPLTNASCSAPT